MEGLEGFTELPGSEGNIFKKILVEGPGDSPKTGQKVSVHYKGYFKDGKVFDQSNKKKKSKPFVCKLGVGQVIKGWDVGVASMKKGEKATFYIKSDYAYGSYGAGADIPPNTDLLFDVELINF